MSRLRRGPALPVPFGDAAVRHQLCATARVCDSTLVKWVLGDQRVNDHYASDLVRACAVLGIVPPPPPRSRRRLVRADSQPNTCRW